MDTPPRTPADPGKPAMFGTLLASRPARSMSGTAVSTLGSVVVHVIIIGGLAVATMRAGVPPTPVEQITLTQLSVQIDPIAPPPTQQHSPVIAGQATVLGYTALMPADMIPNIVPPEQPGVQIRADDFHPVGVAGGNSKGTEKGTPDDLGAAKVFTPAEVQPKLLNQAEVEKVVSRNYPATLRDAGISGKTKLWIHVDSAGRADKWEVKKGSGFDALDSAAMRVAPTLKFTPAMTQLKGVPVWISIDIVFNVR